MDSTELTNNLRKKVASLGSPRGRRETGWFVAEGTRCVLETVGAFKVAHLFATERWLMSNDIPSVRVTRVTQKDIERMSQQQSPQEVMAVYEIPQPEPLPSDLESQLVLALDHVQDPGNMGTIMRIADWFGVGHILASHDTVDIYNPKVVQATMGAIGRVKVHYVDLPATLRELAPRVPVYGTFLNGRDIYESNLTPNGIVVMGNEGNGISPQVAEAVNTPLLIPPFPRHADTVESLNVGVATAITIAEFRRRATGGGDKQLKI